MHKTNTEKSTWQLCTRRGFISCSSSSSSPWRHCFCQVNLYVWLSRKWTAGSGKRDRSIKDDIQVRNKQLAEAPRCQRLPHRLRWKEEKRRLKKARSSTVKDMSHSWVSEWELPWGWTLHCEHLGKTNRTQLNLHILSPISTIKWLLMTSDR